MTATERACSNVGTTQSTISSRSKKDSGGRNFSTQH